MSDLLRFSTFLFLFYKKNEFYVSFQYRQLIHLGGTSIKGAVKYLMDAVMTNEMQTTFNCEGRIEWKTKNNEYKTGFKKTRLPL